MKKLTDEELVVLAQKGNREAFEELVKQYKGMIYSTIYRIMGCSSHQADDMAQDVFIKAYKALPRFRRESKFSTWLFRICFNQCMTERRKKAEKPVYNNPIPSHDQNVERKYERKQLREQVRDLISELPPIYSSVITLRHIDELSYQEISDILNQPQGTIKSKLLRARRKLKDLAVKRIGWERIQEVL